MEESLKIFVETMKNDDIDLLQQLIVSHREILVDFKKFEVLFNLSAILSAIKCFKYFLLNHKSISTFFKFDDELVRSAIIGGNMEIFHLSLEKFKGKSSMFIKDTILFHRTKMLKWLIENNVQFLSIYNCCCSKILYRYNTIQKSYKCNKCNANSSVCKFCAKHFHANNEGEDLHDVHFEGIAIRSFCSNNLSYLTNVKINENKDLVEMDDLILLSVYCLNTEALKILIDEGAYTIRCRDILTKRGYCLGDEKLIELISSLHGYKNK